MNPWLTWTGSAGSVDERATGEAEHGREFAGVDELPDRHQHVCFQTGLVSGELQVESPAGQLVAIRKAGHGFEGAVQAVSSPALAVPGSTPANSSAMRRRTSGPTWPSEAREKGGKEGLPPETEQALLEASLQADCLRMFGVLPSRSASGRSESLSSQSSLAI